MWLDMIAMMPNMHNGRHYDSHKLHKTIRLTNLNKGMLSRKVWAKEKVSNCGISKTGIYFFDLVKVYKIIKESILGL